MELLVLASGNAKQTCAFVCNPIWRECQGCSKRLFKPRGLCISVKGKYTSHHKDKNGNCFDVGGVFRYCVKFDCVTKCPPRSNRTTPSKDIILPADLDVRPEDLELDAMRNLPILSR